MNSMVFRFATCNTKSALDFLSKSHGQEILAEQVPTLIKLIGQDVLRVTDPMMHGNANIVNSSNYGKHDPAELEKAIEEIKSVWYGEIKD
jgi:hypothetical protein